LNQVREQFAAGRVEALVRQTAEEDRDMYPNYEIGMEEEPGASGKVVTNHYAKDVLGSFIFTGERVTGPPEIRARPFLAAAETSQIYMRQAPWNQRLREEFEAFPDGLHDDQVISTAGGYNMLKMKYLKGGVTWGRGKSSEGEDYVIRGPGKSVKVTGATFGRSRHAR
jgi:predicted phage terminase large subunit-like protein